MNHTPYTKGHQFSSPSRSNIPPLEGIPESNSFDEIPPIDSLFQISSKQRKNKSNNPSSPSKSSKNHPIGFPNITNETSVTVFGFPSDKNSCESVIHKFKQFGEVLDVSTSNSNYVTIKYSKEEEAKRVLIYNGTFHGEKPQYMIGVVLTKNIQFPTDATNPITSTHIIQPIETIPIQPPQKIKRPYSVDPDSILKPAKKSKTTLLGKLMSYFS